MGRTATLLWATLDQQMTTWELPQCLLRHTKQQRNECADTQLQAFTRRSTHKRECHSIFGSFPRRCPTQKKRQLLFHRSQVRSPFPQATPSGTSDISSIARLKKLPVRVGEETPAPQLQIECSGAARRIRQVLHFPSLPGNHQTKQKSRGINDVLGAGKRRRTAFSSFSLQMIFVCYKSGELRQAAAENTGLCLSKNFGIPLRKHLQDQSYCFTLKAS